ncbi:vWA domain-containing protein [Thermomonas flagellata]|uniref:vWA domain-containing protein n=1 Tax=Thermomonas flagellata TaxID=2888524 RepID=UPI001F035F1C|nr:VWA domain-containing protein [Thermomonas flagellata]
MSAWLPAWLLPDRFAWPWALLALLLPWLVWWLWPRAPAGEPALRVPWGERLRAVQAGAPGAIPLRRLPWLLLLAWALLCVALARPQRLGEPVAPPRSGREMVLALDLSASMGEQDMELGGRAVDRLTAAKAVIDDFLRRRSGDRVGLIVFGDRAFVLTPPTADLRTVREQLGDTAISLAGRATALGDAIGLAVRRLQAQPPGERVLILLTDGVNTAGVLDPQQAARIARDAGVRIHAIAFGGDGGALSLFGLRLPLGGDEVDEAGLRRIAQATGGRFYRARDTDELAGIYAELDRLEPIARRGPAVRPRIELYPAPLAAGLALLVLALLRRRVA